jgi:Asp-tRNA(Asn)/Glu-tRNA(Gln) amidotransferase C subunit
MNISETINRVLTYLTASLSTSQIIRTLQQLRKKPEESFSQYSQSFIDTASCLEGGLNNTENARLGVEIFLDNISNYLHMKELVGKFDVKSTNDPLSMLEEILTYIQRVQKSDGTSFDPTKNQIKKKIKSKFDNQASKLNGKATLRHWNQLNKIAAYVESTKNYGLLYDVKNDEENVIVLSVPDRK